MMKHPIKCRSSIRHRKHQCRLGFFRRYKVKSIILKELCQVVEINEVFTGCLIDGILIHLDFIANTTAVRFKFCLMILLSNRPHFLGVATAATAATATATATAAV